MADSFQFNYLGCYGNDWIKTPNLDRLAREGVLFENAYGENQPTVPVRRSMLTGRFSLQSQGWTPLGMDETTLADLCWGKPIDTALIFDCPMFRLPKFGYTRGFDKVWFLHGHEADHWYYAQDPLIHYKPEDFHEDHVIESVDEVLGEAMIGPLMEETAAYLKHRQYWKLEEDQNVVKVMKMAVKYLEHIDRNKSFFLWIDSFDPHEPWDPPSVYDPDMECPYDPGYKGKDQFLPLMGPVKDVYTEEELHHIRMLFAEKCTMVDRWIGYLLDNVKRLGLEEDTLIMFVADHGEPMGHGEHGHGIMRKSRPWPYEELVHIPIIMKGPGLPAGARVGAFVESPDVAPTVTDWLGLGVSGNMQGASLLPLARGEVDKVRDFAIAGYYGFSWSIITEDWSYIHWLTEAHKTTQEYLDTFAKDIMKSISAIGRDDLMSEEHRRHREAATLDGEDQWTCTPGAVAQLPERDELYDRKADPFQLNNIIDKHPEKAMELFQQLKEYMAQLRVS